MPYHFFLNLPYLRVLNLSRAEIIELPKSIGTLKHLRHLNLSHAKIRVLPDSMIRLYGLETLKLKGCIYLRKIPSYISELTNLRHLEFEISPFPNFFPRGLGKLTKLQTLSAFVVSEEDGKRIGELQNMSFLHGSICITNLENVVNAKDTIMAELDKKLYLDKLELQWTEFNVGLGEQVFAGLRPHYTIKELTVNGYGGLMFPSWLGDPSFSRLESIYLQNCYHCMCPPELDKLPVLKTLHFHGMHDLKFFSFSSGFPSLQTLALKKMLNLQGFDPVPEVGVMPKLGHFIIEDCPNLCSLPQLLCFSYLEKLEIRGVLSFKTFQKNIYQLRHL
ncbi:putative disease resistance RPP13-like protein 1 [Senna tora]|uniref:Putative disease resistance RPP13-like protein 1 n=1 Tax=Senna tora TaxID=362788 RepID=A0A834TJ13_9FABA|nr:putative disease resistance RPP13-like protein 1 [Senna tora]